MFFFVATAPSSSNLASDVAPFLFLRLSISFIGYVLWIASPIIFFRRHLAEVLDQAYIYQHLSVVAIIVESDLLTSIYLGFLVVLYALNSNLRIVFAQAMPLVQVSKPN